MAPLGPSQHTPTCRLSTALVLTLPLSQFLSSLFLVSLSATLALSLYGPSHHSGHASQWQIVYHVSDKEKQPGAGDWCDLLTQVSEKHQVGRQANRNVEDRLYRWLSIDAQTATRVCFQMTWRHCYRGVNFKWRAGCDFLHRKHNYTFWNFYLYLTQTCICSEKINMQQLSINASNQSLHDHWMVKIQIPPLITSLNINQWTFCCPEMVLDLLILIYPVIDAVESVFNISVCTNNQKIGKGGR